MAPCPRTSLTIQFMTLMPFSSKFMMRVLFHSLNLSSRATMVQFLLMDKPAAVKLILCLVSLMIQR